MLKNTIVALDQLSQDQISEKVKKLDDFTYFKLGLEVFNKYGRDFISDFIRANNKRVFLDLKLHDIPKTVEGAIKSLEGLKIDFLTIHLSGGKSMIKSALMARDKYLPDTKILGVSYLTSLGSEDFNEILGTKPNEINNQFRRLFSLAAYCQVDGLISSPHELHLIKEIEKQTGHSFIKITPGIRFQPIVSDDQKRVTTPKDAFNLGSDFIVMGRAITKNDNIDSVIKLLKS